MTSDMEYATRCVVDLICDELRSPQGIHAETAVSTAARMAGSFLLRSFMFPMDGIEAGAHVFSDDANEEGPKMLGRFLNELKALGVQYEVSAMDGEVDPSHLPLLTLIEVQTRFGDPMLCCVEDARIDDRGMADCCAVAAARLTRAVSGVLSPSDAVRIAGRGFIEGSKSAPIRSFRSSERKRKRRWFGG